MADNNQNENPNDTPDSQESGATPQPSPVNGGVSRRAASLAKTGLGTGLGVAGSAIGGPVGAGVANTILKNPATPGFLALFLMLLAFGAILTVGFGIIGYSGENGRRPEEKAIPGNKQDSLDIQTMQCLNETVKVDTKGVGFVSAKCIKPIQAFSQRSIDMVNAMLPKVPNTPEGEKAKTLLNNLLAAANEAHGVTTQTTLKIAREQRKKLVDALAAANANSIIQKLIGISDNMKKVIAYIQKNNPKQDDPTGCYRKDNEILRKTFNVDFSTAQAGVILPGYDTVGAPTTVAIEATKKALKNDGIPIWFIRGSAKGQHWIIILNIDESNNIFYYDPADGGTHNDPSTWAGTGPWKFFFGSPLDPKYPNTKMRGYIFQP